jgi:hypothetical protein
MGNGSLPRRTDAPRVHPGGSERPVRETPYSAWPAVYGRPPSAATEPVGWRTGPGAGSAWASGFSCLRREGVEPTTNAQPAQGAKRPSGVRRRPLPSHHGASPGYAWTGRYTRGGSARRVSRGRPRRPQPPPGRTPPDPCLTTPGRPRTPSADPTPDATAHREVAAPPRPGPSPPINGARDGSDYGRQSQPRWATATVRRPRPADRRGG